MRAEIAHSEAVSLESKNARLIEIFKGVNLVRVLATIPTTARTDDVSEENLGINLPDPTSAALWRSHLLLLPHL
jgi:hypothetical protein